MTQTPLTTQDAHTSLCQAIGILQAVHSAQENELNDKADWGAFDMTPAAIEAAIALLLGILPEVERSAGRAA